MSPVQTLRLVHLRGAAIPLDTVSLVFGLERLGFSFWHDGHRVCFEGRCLTAQALAYLRYHETDLQLLLLDTVQRPVA